MKTTKLQVILGITFFTFCVMIAAAGQAAVKPGSQAGEKMTLNVRGIDYTFAWCPAGEFVMGSPVFETGRYGAEVPHKVKLSRGFWILETEVTQRMWENVMGTSVRDQCEKAGGHWVTATGPEFPIYYIDWDEAREFCEKLSSLADCQIAMPTEAQWEYACRAGNSGPYAGAEELGETAWFSGNSEYKAHEVKTKKPNAWGIHDMLGNVCEWCRDRYGDYSASPVTDPLVTEGGLTYVYRGGSWDSLERNCRCAFRIKYPTTKRLDYAGLRVVLAPGTEE